MPDTATPILRTAGLLGGMSWESTVTYYQILNRGVRDRLGRLHSAPCLIHSLNFQAIADMQKAGDWTASGALLGEAAAGLQQAGADFILICTNTMHQVAEAVESHIDVPLLHIADATGEAIEAGGMKTVGLLGTRFTMEMGFYRDRLAEKFGIETLVPPEARRIDINRIIFEELCCGILRDESRDALLADVEALRSRGAEAVILGCTEIGLLIDQARSAVPLIDTTQVHAQAALERILSNAPVAA